MKTLEGGAHSMIDEFTKKIIEKLPEYALKGMGTIILFIAPVIPYEKIAPQYLFWPAISFLVLSLFLGGYIISKRRKYIWLPEQGIWKGKKDELYYCPSCKSNKITSPLMENDNGWFCMAKDCKFKRYKPGKAPKAGGLHAIHSAGWEPYDRLYRGL
jgi:hypothetical protein